MALGLAGALALFGQKRENFFLAIGDVNAPAFGMRLTWKIAGPLIALPLIALIATAHDRVDTPGVNTHQLVFIDNEN